MFSTPEHLRTLVLAIGCAFAACVTGAEAAPFLAPQAINPYPYVGQVGLGMDGAGNAIVNFTGEGSFYSVHPAGGAWSTPASVYAGGGGFWNMQTTPSGAATIVSYSSLAGIFYTDRAPGGTWTTPSAVISGAPQFLTQYPGNAPLVQFVGDAKGDEAIVFESLSSTGTTISAVRRFAFGAWGPQETVAASSAYGPIVLGSVALGGNGDLLVAFEPFSVACGVRSCHDINYTVHASREARSSTTWIDAGALFPTYLYEYSTQAVMDDAGRAAIFATALFQTTIQATTQSNARAKWHALVSAAGFGYMFAAGTPAKGGSADLALDASGTGFGVTILEGSLATDTWPSATVLSTLDSASVNYGVAFSESRSGSAIAAWTDTDGTVRATTRTSGGVWAVPQTVTTGSACDIGGLQCTVVDAVAIDAAGHAAIAFTRLNANDTAAQLFVTTNN